MVDKFIGIASKLTLGTSLEYGFENEEMLNMYKLVEQLTGVQDGLEEMNEYVNTFFSPKSDGGSSAAADVEAAQAEDKKHPPRASEKIKCLTNSSYKKIKEFLEAGDDPNLEFLGN